jgi:iron complex outermembrane receptor protein
MIKKILPVFLVGTFCFTHAQEKSTDIETIEVQGKLISTPYKTANQNITIITREEIMNSPAKASMKFFSRFGNGYQKERSQWCAE